MTTQEMYNNGLRCRGKGLHCPTCKSKIGCVEYVNCDVKSKPPLGVMPKKIWELQRISDLKDAIDRYANAQINIPIEWIEEYNDLVSSHKE